MANNHSNTADNAKSLVFQPVNEPQGDVLVNIFLRGGMDGLFLVPPHADPHYQTQRGVMGLPDPGQHDGIVDLDGFFGLHPQLVYLTELFQDKKLAIIHACGGADKTLSHFEAQRSIERGFDNAHSLSSGWLARYLLAEQRANDTPLRAVAIAKTMPEALMGTSRAVAFSSIREFKLEAPPAWQNGFVSTLNHLYSPEGDSVCQSGNQMLVLLKSLRSLQASDYVPTRGVRYPAFDFARDLAQVAQLIKAEIGLEIATIDLHGWDTHIEQAEGLSTLVKTLARALNAFAQDLEKRFERVTVVVMTEFGRRVIPNSALGTDHGRGTAMFVLGGGIAGGKVYGKWPGIGNDQLDSTGNLLVTTDLRSVLSEILDQRMRCQHLSDVFPGFAPQYLNLAAKPSSV
jgi:uncharacterized protein (DUF1501 family)